MKFFRLILIGTISLSSSIVMAQNFPRIGYESTGHKELTITPEQSRQKKLNDIKESIIENKAFYKKSLTVFEKKQQSYYKIRNSKTSEQDIDKIYDARKSFIDARKQVNYYLGNIYYLEGHLYDLEHKPIKDKIIQKRIDKHLTQ